MKNEDLTVQHKQKFHSVLEPKRELACKLRKKGTTEFIQEYDLWRRQSPCHKLDVLEMKLIVFWIWVLNLRIER
ncbi:uncharacterized protein LOC142234588 isoform X1 [Haematobia irritans]|uniref:uncharacterized protein LOC142234588 isoform X1 n=1 Tax=Haematobia irritans TaxID=7368 RepID=UPI003F4FDD44